MTWGFDGAHGTDVRPAHKDTVYAWAKDPSGPTSQDGTRLSASLINRLIGNVRRLAQRFGVSLTEDGDDDIADCIVAAIGATAPKVHTHDDRYHTIATVDAALAEKAPLASPTLTGTPAAPTASGGTNTTQIATTAFVQAAIAALINSAPGVLDTLDEIAAALGDDASFAATMTAALADKAPLASPTFTGTPAAPTATGGTNTTQLATTAFVQAAIAAIAAGVVSFNGRTGTVSPANDDYAVGNLAAIADATLVGNNTGGSARPLALTAAQARTLLGLVLGTDVQAYDADLAAIAAFSPTKGRLLVGDGSAWQVLAAGTNGHALVADSGEATGLKYAAAGGGVKGMQLFTSSGTYTPTSGTTKAIGFVTGGGGGSWQPTNGGAGAGATAIDLFTISGTESVTIGAGGSSDGAGGTSTFKGVSAAGGSGTSGTGGGSGAAQPSTGLVRLAGASGVASDGSSGSGASGLSFWGYGYGAGGVPGAAGQAGCVFIIEF